MFSGKFLYTLLAIVVAVFALCKTEFAQPIVENFLNYHLDVKAVPVVRNLQNCRETALGGNFVNPDALKGSGKFFQTANMQAVLAPRFTPPQGLGSMVKYNMPDVKNQAGTCDPMTFGDMAKENFRPPRPSRENMKPNIKKPSAKKEGFEHREDYGCGVGQCGGGDGGVPSCGKGGYGLGREVGGAYELPIGYKNGNYGDIYNTLTLDGENAPVVSRPCDDMGGCNNSRGDLPIGTMSTTEGDGEEGPQFVIENRLMYSSNPKSRLYAQRDAIRGDIPIIPEITGKFDVYPNIAQDLSAGALAVMGGGSENYAQTQSLLMAATGGVKTTFSGVDFSQSGNKFQLATQLNMANMATQSKGMLSSMNSDAMYNVEPSIDYTSFP